jgi:outer membrane protein W
VEYHFNSARRIVPYAGLGMQYGMLISDVLQYKVIGANRVFETKDAGIWNRNSISTVGHLGMAIKVYPKNIFTLAIAAQYGLNSATTTELNRNQYGCNLQLGWRVDF